MSDLYTLLSNFISTLPWISIIVLVFGAGLLGWKSIQTRLGWLRLIVIGLALQVLAFAMAYLWGNFYWVVTGPASSFTQETYVTATIIDAGVTLANQLLNVTGTVLILWGIYRAVVSFQMMTAAEDADGLEEEEDEELESVDGYDLARETALAKETDSTPTPTKED